MTSKPKHFLSLADIPASELRAILDEAHARKAARQTAGKAWTKGRVDADAPLSGQTVALLFEKSSTRTRFSFDMGMRQLGGTSITATSADMQLGRGETIEDTAKVLSRFVDGIMLRANSHETLTALAHNADIPVINGLTDYNHPCQIMADLQTLEEQGRTLKDMSLTWVGDGNNVAMSFVNAAAKFGYRLVLSCPEGYQVRGQDVERARANGARIEIIQDPVKACAATDVVIADTWVSMGDADADQRMKDLADWQADDRLMKAAQDDALFLHCLPAHRGEEVSASVIDGPQSVVFDEAENRLHAQKAILTYCLNA
ncbi:MAG: ornithine carbamoyltransferase [Robiginitomaculum sp.]|nr:MAG: ornithine carbamoyltransferase [Robiginitomaculum sp.]